MLKEKLKDDLKTAMKSGDTVARATIPMVSAAIKNRELEKRGKLSKEGQMDHLEEFSQLTDEEAIEVIASEIKKRRESVATYRSGGRPELAEGEQKEIEFLMRYMPEQMSEEQIREEVKKVIAETKATMKEVGLPVQAGKAIGAVMAKVKGKADGTVVSRIMKEELSR